MKIRNRAISTSALTVAFALAGCGSEATPVKEKHVADATEGAAIPAAQWIDYDTATFARAQEQGRTIMVDVNASWCPTCKAQAPTLDAMRENPEMAGVVFMKLDFDTQKAFLEEHRVPRQSTILVFRGDQETARTVAETDPEKLREAILAGV